MAKKKEFDLSSIDISSFELESDFDEIIESEPAVPKKQKKEVRTSDTEELYSSLEDLENSLGAVGYEDDIDDEDEYDDDYEDDDYEDDEYEDDEYEDEETGKGLDEEEYDDDESYDSVEDWTEEAPRKRNKTPLIAAAAAAAVLVVGGGVTYFQLTSFAKADKKIVVELGEQAPAKASAYIEGSGYAVKKAQVDLGQIDTSKVGTYQAVVSFMNKKVEVPVEVADTVIPEVELKQDIEGYTGKKISAEEIIEKATDKAGIASIQFEEAQVDSETESSDIASIF